MAATCARRQSPTARHARSRTSASTGARLPPPRRRPAGPASAPTEIPGMPFFHDQDRSSLRRAYLEAWRKRREGIPMEPLEHQLATVVEEHPEYQAFIE